MLNEHSGWFSKSGLWSFKDINARGVIYWIYALRDVEFIGTNKKSLQNGSLYIQQACHRKRHEDIQTRKR